MPDNVFKPRPNLDADRFINGGQLHEVPPLPSAPTTAAVIVPPTSSPRIKQGIGSHSYKHKTNNFMRLRRLAQRLDMPVGTLLDEALEAKMPEFEERAGKVSW